MSADTWKRQAAERALAFLEDGMKLGLGTGSTAAKFVDLVGARVKEGLELTCVPTSEATRAQAERLGIRAHHAGGDARSRSHRRRRRRARRRAAPDQGRRRGAAAREDRGHGVAAHGGHRRRLQARRHARQVPAAGGGRAVRRRCDPPAARTAGRGSGLHRRDQAARRAEGGRPFVTDGGNHLLDCAFGRIEQARGAGPGSEAHPGRGGERPVPRALRAPPSLPDPTAWRCWSAPMLKVRHEGAGLSRASQTIEQSTLITGL